MKQISTLRIILFESILGPNAIILETQLSDI